MARSPSTTAQNRVEAHLPKILPLILTALSLPMLAAAQAVKSQGNQNVNTAINNGNITVNNTIVIKRSTVRKKLKAEATLEALNQGEWQGILYPGAKRTDLGPCTGHYTPRVTDTVVKMGGAVAICTSLPCFLLSVNGRIVLSVEQLSKSVGIVAEFRATDGKMVAVLDGNKWHANQKESWYAQRPDEHSIQVMDDRNTEMLWVSLENAHFIVVRGDFRDEEGQTAARVADADFFLKGMNITSGCFVGPGVPNPAVYVMLGGPEPLFIADTHPREPGH